MNEEDEKKKLESVASYRKVDANANQNKLAENPKYRNKTPVKFQNHELELSCTERISRQRYNAAAGNQVNVFNENAFLK